MTNYRKMAHIQTIRALIHSLELCQWHRSYSSLVQYLPVENYTLLNLPWGRWFLVSYLPLGACGNSLVLSSDNIQELWQTHTHTHPQFVFLPFWKAKIHINKTCQFNRAKQTSDLTNRGRHQFWMVLGCPQVAYASRMRLEFKDQHIMHARGWENMKFIAEVIINLLIYQNHIIKFHSFTGYSYSIEVSVAICCWIYSSRHFVQFQIKLKWISILGY